MRGGAYGRLLHVDLSSRTARVEEPDASLFCRFLGGRGLAGALLRPHVSRSWDDPELPLAILTGALSGTAAPGSNRACIASRSPLTSTFLDSAVGGGLASAIKHAGLDGIVIRGASENLVGLRIVGGAVEFLDAAHMAGRSTADVYTDVLGDAPADPPAFTAIGPAGEAGVAVANIIVDRHFPTGRGLGAVMGAKKLKWLAVCGTQAVPVVDATGLQAARVEVLRLTAASPFLQGQFGISNYGTAALFDLAHSRRMLPTDNFRRTWFDHQGALSAPVLVQRYKAQNSGCAGCHIHCARIAQSELGGEVGWPLPEFDALSHLSALIGNADPDLAVRLNLRCIALGLDPLSTGGVLATRREIMSGNDAPAELLNLLDDIAHGRGEGEILGQGAYRYADALGRPEAAMTVKGMELPALDPRGAYGLALGYAVATRGGCYLRAFPISHEILRKPVATDRFSFAAKARMIKIAEDVIAAADSLGVCTFMLLAAGLEEYGAAMAAVTGEPWEQGDLMRIGERIVYQERCMLREAGCGPESDDLPARFFHEAGSETETQTIPALDRDAFLKARGAYYSVRGLDEAGNPLPEKAEALGLECPKVGPVSERLDDARR